MSGAVCACVFERRRGGVCAHLHALARVLALVLAVTVVVVALGLRTLKARASELIGGAGAQLLSYPGARSLDGVHELRLNGLSLQLNVATTPDPPERVLALVGERCRARSGRLAAQLPPGRTATRRSQDAAGVVSRAARWLDPVLQLADEHGGFAACLDLGAGRVDGAELLARMQRFVPDGDVSELGALRCAWAWRERTVTRYVTVSSDRALPLRRAFPAQGDAPGSDVPHAPRPPASRRVLSAWQQGAAPLLVAYRSGRPASAALRDYERQLRASGYHVQRAAGARADALIAVAAERSLTAAAVPQGREGSLLIVTPLR